MFKQGSIFEVDDPSLVNPEQIWAEIEKEGYCGIWINSPRVGRGDLIEWIHNLRNKYGGGKISHTHGIIKHYGIGQAPFMWDLREWLKPLFEKLWKSTELLCSLDGANYSTYYSTSRTKPYNWLHRDQRPEDEDFKMIQGCFQLNNSGGGLSVVPKSHLIKFQGIKTHSDWFKIPEDFKKGAQIKDLKANHPGQDILWLWDSRLWHANHPPKEDEQARHAFYITFAPKPKNWTLNKRQKRKRFIEQGETTSHWPYKLKKNGLPRFYHSPKQGYIPQDAKGEISKPNYPE